MKTDLTAAGYVFHRNNLLLIYHSKLNLWLPPGGHIEPNETPDDAVIREVKEETGLDVKIIDIMPLKIKTKVGIKRQTSIPFYTNVHSVGDHDHWGACFLCKSESSEVHINSESRKYKWLSKEELEMDTTLREDIKEIALLAFQVREGLSSFL